MCHLEPKPLVETFGARIGWNHGERDGKSAASALLDNALDDGRPDALTLEFRQDLYLVDV